LEFIDLTDPDSRILQQVYATVVDLSKILVAAYISEQLFWSDIYILFTWLHNVIDYPRTEQRTVKAVRHQPQIIGRNPQD